MPGRIRKVPKKLKKQTLLTIKRRIAAAKKEVKIEKLKLQSAKVHMKLVEVLESTLPGKHSAREKAKINKLNQKISRIEARIKKLQVE